MRKRISLDEFIIIVTNKAETLGITRIVSIGTRVKNDDSFYVIFCEDSMGRESVIEIPYYSEV